jgi:hypothetical protein
MITCDICGNAKDVQTGAFGLDGKTYEIDLCPKDRKGLSQVAARYVPKARKITARRGPQRNGRRQRVRAETARIGDSGSAPGMKTPRRGRTAGSTREEAKANRSGQQAAKLSGAKAKAAGPEQEPKASDSGLQKARAASKQAAKRTGARHKGIYVYGILPADIEVAAEMRGVGEHPGLLRVVRSDGLAALISEVDPSGPLGSPDDLRTHREILNATATEVPVLPLHVGTVLASEDAVAEELLAAHHGEFAAALEQFEGRTQFVVKGRYIEQAAAAKREQDTRALEQAMKGICVASARRRPAHELDAVRVAFLVAADQESEMEQAIEDLARDWEGRVEVQLLGPMAAYDFAGPAKPEG